jgi:hypothetical protein
LEGGELEEVGEAAEEEEEELVFVGEGGPCYWDWGGGGRRRRRRGRRAMGSFLIVGIVGHRRHVVFRVAMRIGDMSCRRVCLCSHDERTVSLESEK